MAIAERRLAAEFNRPGHDIVDHRTYVVCSDGDLQEGVASEASSLAGTSAGQADRALRRQPDPARRADGLGVHRGRPRALRRLRLAHAAAWRRQRRRGHRRGHRGRQGGRPAVDHRRPDRHRLRLPNKQDTQKAHGAPLGPDEVRLTKEAYGWDPDRRSTCPTRPARCSAARSTRARPVADVGCRARRYAAAFPAEAAELRRRVAGRLAAAGTPRCDLRARHRGRDAQRQRTRSRPLAAPVPELFGGSADLSESNLTDVKANGHDHFEADHPGATCGSASASTPWAASSTASPTTAGSCPTGTFLMFSDYMRGAVRLAALSELHVIYVWTHDSVGLGEDGPTHQPVEHYAALRAIPNLWFVRPGRRQRDRGGVGARRRAAGIAGAPSGPVALALTRQKLPTLAGHRRRSRARGCGAAATCCARRRGGDAGADPHRHGVRAPARVLGRRGARGRRHPDPRRDPPRAGSASRRRTRRTGTVLPPGRKRVRVEAGVSLGWERYVGDEGAIIGIDHFGASAPAGTIFKAFGFTVDRVADVARRVVREGLHGRDQDARPRRTASTRPSSTATPAWADAVQRPGHG